MSLDSARADRVPNVPGEAGCTQLTKGAYYSLSISVKTEGEEGWAGAHEGLSCATENR